MSSPTLPRPGVPTTPDLRAALQVGLRASFAPGCRVARVQRSASAYATSAALENLDVELGDGRVLRLVFKDVGRAALLDGARRAKPAFLYDPLREIQCYRTVLNEPELGTASCYATVADERRGHYWLFLERVPGVELYQVGELETWQHAAAWLARLHDRFLTSPGRLASVHGRLLRYDGEFYRRWSRRALRFARLKASEAQLRRLESIVGRYDRVVERLVELPRTFIHGEFYASNVLVQREAVGTRICPVDWETAALGPGLVDLAALTAGPWSERDRSAIVAAYRTALPTAPLWRLSEEDFATLLDCCGLHVALQWLGWSGDWTPPSEHAFDWLAEALRLAERLGL